MMKPQLFPNEMISATAVTKDYYAPYKLDGIRALIIPSENKDSLLTRSKKLVQNKQLQEKFKPLIARAVKRNCILDGELYSHELTFQEITRAVMTEDLFAEKKIKQYMKEFDYTVEEAIAYTENLIDKIEFHCFDYIWSNNYEEQFQKRLSNAFVYDFDDIKGFIPVEHKIIQPHRIVQRFEEALEDGYEGIMLRDPTSPYKCGRITFKSGNGYKFKPYETFDAKIIEVTQRTEARKGSEKKINELGRSVTSKKKDDRIPIEMASAFLVEYEKKEVLVVIAMSDKEKKKVWKDRDSYIGKMIEYKGMLLGSKDVPRHPVMLRFINPNSK